MANQYANLSKRLSKSKKFTAYSSSSSLSTSVTVVDSDSGSGDDWIEAPVQGLNQSRVRRTSTRKGEPVKYFAVETELQDKLVGVVVTIFQGSSYDPMFREVKPTSAPGERVSTYSIQCSDVKLLHDYLTAAMPVPAAWEDLVDDIAKVDADGVVFNWECCGACGDHPFPSADDTETRSRASRPMPKPNEKSETMEFMGLAMRRGFTVMCSDFSLKSLIHDWSEEHLGPNPFVRVGECSDYIQLEFVPTDLSQNEEVPQQLQVVGQLCSDDGKAVVKALGSTIVYSVRPDRPKTHVYELKVLTVASNFGGSRTIPSDLQCSIGTGQNIKHGAAGHVTLTYADGGGQLVTSMGHWIELTRIETSLESVMRCAAREFGEEEFNKYSAEYSTQTSDAARYECLQRQSKALVQKSVPSRMKCRTKF